MSAYWQRRKQMTEETHIDDWLMTYADMITLLLCFFAVFIAIAHPDKEKFEEAKQQVKEQFSKVGNSDSLKGTFALPPTKLDTPPESEMPFEALPSIIDRYNDEGKKDDVEIEKSDRITTIEMNSGTFFDIGSADLNEEGKKLLTDLLPTIQSEEYMNYAIAIEGYTDDSPIKTAQFPSNWELSTARAAAVVREMIALGIEANRLRAVGFGDTNPKVENRNASGEPIAENQAQNRRVVIRLEKITKAK